MTTLIIGAGYVGSQLAHHLNQDQSPYLAVVSNTASLARLAPLNAESLDLDRDEPAEICSLFSTSDFQVIYLVPPNAHFSSDVRLARFLSNLATPPKRFVYVSTSGVYGDLKGHIANEHTPLSPKTARAKLRVDAEQQVLTYCSNQGVSHVILRVPGIYGPGRLPIEAIKKQRGFIQLSEANPGNRIHRDDLINCLIAAMSIHAEGVYNIGDGNYMSSTEFAIEVSKLANLDLPKQVNRATMKSAASMRRWSFLSESRRLDNTKLLGLLQELEMPLAFSNPIDGIKHSLG